MASVLMEKADGVELIRESDGGGHYSHKSSATSNAAWALGGAVVGYAARSVWDNSRRHGGEWGGKGGFERGGEWGCAPFAGCSENSLVNRFELKQSEELACKDAEIAKLKSEKYTDNKTQEANYAMMAYVDRAVGKVCHEVECLEKEVRCLGDSAIRTEERLTCLNKDFAAFQRQTAEQFHSVRCFVEHEIKEEHEWACKEFLHQPKVKVVCGTPTFGSCDCDCDTATA